MSFKKPTTKQSAHVKRGDTVVVISGSHKGQTGVVKCILTAKQRVIVEGVNVIKKAVKANPMAGIEGGFLSQEAPLHLSNVMFFDPVNQVASRLGRQWVEDESKTLVKKRSAKKERCLVDDASLT
jgi:large subunit ribosomal protein L24